MLDALIDLSRPVWAVWTTFPLAEHMARLAAAHPAWTDRQLRCVLYWQPAARKALREVVGEFLRKSWDRLTIHIAVCPEANGCNLTETMKTASRGPIILQWPPMDLAYQIVLAGIRKE
jgi:hypothetical protein